MESLRSRDERMNRPDYRRQRTRTVLGVKLVQLGSGGGRWATMEDDPKLAYTLEIYENDEGGYCLWGADPIRSLWFHTLKAAVAWIVRVRAFVADAEGRALGTNK